MSVRAVLGGKEGSVLDVWGGEYEWDMFDVILHSKRGKDNGVVIEYGKNLTSLEQDNDFSSVYTHLLPYAVIKNGDTESVVTLSEITIPIVETYARRKHSSRIFRPSLRTEKPLPRTHFEQRRSHTSNRIRSVTKLPR